MWEYYTLLLFGRWFICHFKNLWNEGKSEQQRALRTFPANIHKLQNFTKKGIDIRPLSFSI